MIFVLFDIDGTLVDSNYFDTKLYLKAVFETLEINISSDWNVYNHVSDSGILFQVIEENNLLRSASGIIKQVKKRFAELIDVHVSTKSNRVNEIPGAYKLIRHLSTRNDVIIGIATGGWEETAKIKLKSIGLDPDQFAIATSSDSEKRIEIMNLAEKRAINGRNITRKFYFGDGDWDKKASNDLGYEFVGVGNKVKSKNQILDFTNKNKILRILGIE